MKKFSFAVLVQAATVSMGLFIASQPACATDYVWSGADGASSDWFSTKNWKASGLTTSLDKSSAAVSTDLAIGEINAAPAIAERSLGVPGPGDTATITAGAVIAINKSVTLSALTVQEDSVLQGAGNITVTSNLVVRDAQLSGEGSILIPANATASFSVQKSSGNTVAKSIDNRGTLNWVSGNLSLQKDFRNKGKFNIASEGALKSDGLTKSVFYNEGTLVKSGGGESDISTSFKNSGDISVRGGILDIGPDYVQTAGSLSLDGGNLASSGTLQVNGGILAGSGTIDCDVVNDGGTFKPGHSPGYVAINGNYTQTANGILNMEVGGTSPGTGYDQMSVSGSCTLGGTLDITKFNNYMPVANTGFEFIICWDIHSDFSAYKGLYPGNSLYYIITWATSSFIATVKSDTVSPTVAISTPANGGRYLGVNSVRGTASDAESGVANVSIVLYRYANGSTPTGFLAPGNTWTSAYSAANSLLASGTSNWVYSMANLAPGQYHVKAVARDNVGRVVSTSNNLFNVTPSGSGYVSLPERKNGHLRIAALQAAPKAH